MSLGRVVRDLKLHQSRCLPMKHAMDEHQQISMRRKLRGRNAGKRVSKGHIMCFKSKYFMV